MRLEQRYEPPTETPTAREPDEKQLRLGVVCYGGLSLAIYMYGVVREIAKVVIASTAFERDQETNPFDTATTEHTYWNILHDLRARDGIRRKVVVDVISGTSAGGINGVFLAKAIAANRSLAPLRDLWMDKGSITRLAGWRGFRLALWLPFEVALPRAAGLVGQLLRPIPGLKKLRRMIPPTRAPLRGDLILRWLRDALDDTQGSNQAVPGSDGPLLPHGHELELFVTTTDFHGQRYEIWIDHPAHVPDAKHRQVMRFTHGSAQFDATHHPDLAFAAAATSAFPGAFPPVSIPVAAGALGGGWTERFITEQFSAYALTGANAGEARFIDGGLLDNFPFTHAVGAIQRRPAAGEVRRRLIYIEPHPAQATPRRTGEPSLLGSIARALVTIPLQEPILDDLLDVKRFNERVAGLGEVIERSERAVGRALRPELEQAITTMRDASALEQHRDSIHERVAPLAGPGYPGYLQLKQVSTVRQLSAITERVSGFPDGSNHAIFTREVWLRWARREKILPVGDILEKEQIAFLRSFDLAYSERRLRFLIQKINKLYEGTHTGRPKRDDLNTAKRALYELITTLGHAASGDELEASVTARIRTLFKAEDIARFVYGERSAGAFAREHADELREISERLSAEMDRMLHDFTWTFYSTANAVTKGWARSVQRELLERYLAFPLWDTITYPLRALGDAGEMQPIGIVRFSPNEATAMGRSTAEEKLQGIKIMHFGAFFRRAWREQDYLWGRLDGVEHVVRMLLEETDPDPKVEQVHAAARPALDAVFQEERALRAAGRLARALGRT
ncbi:MAG TPA: patatin-like protein [Actinomycetota bacterium]